MLVSRSALAIAIVSGTWSGVARAQDTAPAPAATARADTQPDIVVTGSRIARRDTTSQTPIVTIGQEAIASRGSPTLETTLNQLPQFAPSAGSASSFNARGGQANLNLRALGSQRTLVLVDGRRLQPANPDGSADLNVLPSALIESVETITGGASAVYGSDAISGVVNIKLRRRFEGVELGGQTSITDKGDAATRELSITAGTSFAGGRGNVTLAAVYSARDSLGFRARPYLDDQALSTNTPNGILLVNAANLPSQAAVNAIFARYGAATGSVSRSTALSFNADGTIFRAQNSLLGYNGPTTGIYTTYNNSLYADTGYFNYAQVPLERYTGYGRAEYELGSSTKMFVQGLYTRYDATTAGPPPNSSSTSSILTVPVTNPFIPADLQALLASRANPTAPFTIQKRFDVLGARTEHDRYDVYQITAGADGKLGLGDVAWSAYATLGRTLYTAHEINYPSISAVQNLLNAADGGNELCSGGFNPFGPQPISDACRAYIARNAESTTSLRQFVVEGTLTGSLFALPAGKVRFAAGADYRRTSYAFTPDAVIASGDLANFLPTSSSGGHDAVKEIYGELLIPVLADVPMFRSLNVDLGYRYSDYRISGGASTYKADLDWKPIDAVMVRGGYARAIRAPSVGDMFSATTLDSASLGTLGPIPGGDPCDIRSGYRAGGYAGATQVRSLCLAQGVPANLIDSYINGATRARTITAGNLALKPETADTFSIGMVFAPVHASGLFRRFTLSVDYYNIKIKDALGNISGPLAVQRCFNADGSNPTYDPNNQFCQLISRESATGQIGGISNPRLNLGGYRTAGIDIAASWPIPLSELGLKSGTVTLGTDLSYLDKFEIQTLPGAAFLDYAGTIQNTQIDLFSSARPRWKATSSLRYSGEAFDLGLRWRYIGPMNNSGNVGVAKPALPHTASVSYFDLDFGVKVAGNFELRGGVTNLFDRTPPISVLSPVGAYTIDLNTYDIVGRRMFIGFKAKF
ncbi:MULTISPECIES: TonB-dependent receptor [unclassified Sphingomonas]|uniref:TonB-dependent receptor domain-containing protein n=1 Tax=unclassified Sphingomonas TaxID=196159 RepID=UPI0009293DB0|nr:MULTISPECIES: TonB-dependent receptor [unclassified Sphingomonas]OJU22463.1 MAG: hypothetical protein BGN95_02690 [Sphingomonas sp. 66-10]